MTEKAAARMTAVECKRWRDLANLGNGNVAVLARADMKFCESLEKRGFATCYDSMFGYHYYSLTRDGKRQIYR